MDVRQNFFICYPSILRSLRGEKWEEFWMWTSLIKKKKIPKLKLYFIFLHFFRVICQKFYQNFPKNCIILWIVWRFSLIFLIIFPKFSHISRKIYLKFLAVFRNEITTILTPSTSEGWEVGVGAKMKKKTGCGIPRIWLGMNRLWITMSDWNDLIDDTKNAAGRTDFWTAFSNLIWLH